MKLIRVCVEIVFWEKIYRNLRESNYGNYIIMEIMSSWDYLIRRYKWVFIEVGFVEK